MNEKNLQNQAMIQLSRQGSTCFRNNVGTGWVGKPTFNGSKLTLENYRPLQAGLCKGSSDLIGWTPIQVTSDMIGMVLAVFSAWEIKTPTGIVSKEQKNFIEVVNNSGGHGRIIRSIKEI